MLVQVQDLLNYMNLGTLTITTNQQSALTSILAGVQQQLETYLRRPVEPIQIREAIQTDQRGFAYPTVTPVQQLINQTPLTLPGLQPYVTQDISLPAITDESSIVSRPVLDWTTGVVQTTFFEVRLQHNRIYIGWPLQWVSLEYIGGWRGYDIDGLKLDIMRVATRDAEPIVDDTIGRRQDTTEEPQSSDKRLTGWTIDELTKWDSLRRRIVV